MKMEMDLDRAGLTEEIVSILENAQTMILATCADNQVTARSMAVINDGLTILFQTGGHSEKINQLTANRSVAFAVDNIQIEAVARIIDDPEKVRLFLEKYKVKYPHYYAAYSNMPGQVTVLCAPIRFAIYKFINGKPCTDILDVDGNRAYRKVLT